MKFKDLKAFLKDGFMNNYLLLGNDSFLISKAYELILNSKNFEPFELNVISFTEDIDFNEVVKALETMPVFSEYKLVYVNLNTDGSVSNINGLVEYFKNLNPTSILVVNAGNDKSKVEKVVDYFEVVDCNRLDDEMVKKLANLELSKFGKQITSPALQKLCVYGLFNLTHIMTEINKLVAFVGSEKIIQEQHVEDIVTKNIEYQIFDLTESLGKKNSDKAYEILNDIKANKENEKTLLPLIYSHFRRLLHVKLNSNSSAEVAKLLKVKEFAIKYALVQSKLFTAKALKEINEICLNLDFAVKNGDMTNQNAINYLVLQILNI